jgi:hypothetical protein
MHIDLSARSLVFNSVTAAVLLFGAANANANFWNLRDPDFQSGRTNWSDLTDFPQQGFNFSTSPALDSNGGSSWTKLKLNNQDLTLTESGDTVLNLRSLVINGGTLTLEATAGTAIIINVKKKFSLNNAASIVLTGGVQATDIVFNVLGQGRPVTISGESSMTGTIDALGRRVQITNNSTVFGVVNAQYVTLAAGGSIVPPPVVSN